MAKYVLDTQFLFHFMGLTSLLNGVWLVHDCDPYVVFLNETLRTSARMSHIKPVQKRRSEESGCAIPALLPEVLRC
jgi:hypothetical protein